MTERSERAGEPVGSLAEEAAKLWDALSRWAGEEDARQAAPKVTPDVAPNVAPDVAPGDRDGRAKSGAVPGELFEAAAHTARGLAEALRRFDEHVATDGAECRYCPWCRAIHAVRETSPEVRQHLGDAAGSLLSAAASLVADRGHPEQRADDDRGGPAPS